MSGLKDILRSATMKKATDAVKGAVRPMVAVATLGAGAQAYTSANAVETAFSPNQAVEQTAEMPSLSVVSEMSPKRNFPIISDVYLSENGNYKSEQLESNSMFGVELAPATHLKVVDGTPNEILDPDVENRTDDADGVPYVSDQVMSNTVIGSDRQYRSWENDKGAGFLYGDKISSGSVSYSMADLQRFVKNRDPYAVVVDGKFLANKNRIFENDDEEKSSSSEEFHTCQFKVESQEDRYYLQQWAQDSINRIIQSEIDPQDKLKAVDMLGSVFSATLDETLEGLPSAPDLHDGPRIKPVRSSDLPQQESIKGMDFLKEQIQKGDRPYLSVGGLKPTEGIVPANTSLFLGRRIEQEQPKEIKLLSEITLHNLRGGGR